MSRLRIVRPPERQLTLDELTTAPQPGDLSLVDRALPLARQLELMAQAVGPASFDVAHELVELLERNHPARPRRVA